MKRTALALAPRQIAIGVHLFRACECSSAAAGLRRRAISATCSAICALACASSFTRGVRTVAHDTLR
jgi:hypothetical protein